MRRKSRRQGNEEPDQFNPLCLPSVRIALGLPVRTALLKGRSNYLCRQRLLRAGVDVVRLNFSHGSAQDHIDRANLAIAAPYIRAELGINAAEMGLVLSAFFWTYAIMQLPFGWFIDRVYGTPHGADLVSESSRQCKSTNAAASQRFAELVRATIAAQVRRGQLDLRRAGLDEAALTELLLRAAYGLKSPDPVPLSAAEFQTRVHQLIGLLCASLIPQHPHAPRTRRSR